MGLENVIKNIKEIHPERVILVQIGTFYHMYGRDSYIISYLFGYQIKSLEKNLSTCGFPKSGLNKVLKEVEFKTENKYLEYYNKAQKYIAKKNKMMEQFIQKNLKN